jgi:hypothetical protein
VGPRAGLDGCGKSRPIDKLYGAIFNNYYIKVKVKVTLEQATKVQRGSRGKSLPFL